MSYCIESNESISIDDRVSAHGGAGAGSRRGSHHHRDRCCLTLKTLKIKL